MALFLPQATWSAHRLGFQPITVRFPAWQKLKSGRFLLQNSNPLALNQELRENWHLMPRRISTSLGLPTVNLSYTLVSRLSPTSFWGSLDPLLMQGQVCRILGSNWQMPNFGVKRTLVCPEMKSKAAELPNVHKDSNIRHSMTKRCSYQQTEAVHAHNNNKLHQGQKQHPVIHSPPKTYEKICAYFNRLYILKSKEC